VKKVSIVFFVVALLAGGAIAYAHDTGWFGGEQQGHTYGHYMVEPDYGGHMMDWTGAYDQEFPDETTDMETELINDRCEYEDFYKLEEDLYTESPRSTYRGVDRNCWEY
jgi:hypothetical protein